MNSKSSNKKPTTATVINKDDKDKGLLAPIEIPAISLPPPVNLNNNNNNNTNSKEQRPQGTDNNNVNVNIHQSNSEQAYNKLFKPKNRQTTTNTTTNTTTTTTSSSSSSTVASSAVIIIDSTVKQQQQVETNGNCTSNISKNDDDKPEQEQQESKQQKNQKRHRKKQKNSWELTLFEKSLEGQVSYEKTMNPSGNYSYERRGGDGDTRNYYNNDNVDSYSRDYNSSSSYIKNNNSVVKNKSHEGTYDLEEEEEEEEAEEILGLESNTDSASAFQHQQDYGDIVLTTTTTTTNITSDGGENNLSLKYISTGNNPYSSNLPDNSSNVSYSPSPLRTATNTYNKNHDWYPATYTTISSSTAGSETYTVNRSNSSLPSSLECSSIWDGINSLCGVKSCSKPASKKCICKASFYCSEEHQKLDWKHHKKNCLPYKMELINEESNISAMVATRNLEAGKLIFSETPFLVFANACEQTDFLHIMDLACVMQEDWVTSCTAKTPACIGCMKTMNPTANLRKCSKCGLPLCSNNCEYVVPHQLGECNAIQRSECRDRVQAKCFHRLYLDIEILRALELRNYETNTYQKLLALRNHDRVENYKKSERFAKFVRKMTNLVPMSVKVSGNQLDLISDIHAIITALSFKPSLKSPYKMLIATQLHFAHDCLPNALQYIEEQVSGDVYKMKCVVKSSSTIIKGNIISLDFLPTPYLSYPLRRKALENLYLNCVCTRCKRPAQLQDHSSDILCLNCKRGYVVPETPEQWSESVWSCIACQEEVPYSQVKEVTELWKERLIRIPKGARTSKAQLFQFIGDSCRQLHPQHELRIMAFCFLEQLIRPTVESNQVCFDAKRILPFEDIHDFEMLSEYCDVALQHIDYIRPGIWLDKGIIMFYKFVSSFYIAAKEHQIETISRKEFITRVVKSMKVLTQALQILQVYEGYDATCVQKLTEQANYALTTVKEYIGKFIKEDTVGSAQSFRRLV